MNLLQHWRDVLEILILWIGIYQIYRVFRATRGARVLVGLLAILIVVTLAAYLARLEVIGWIITRSSLLLTFVLVVIFQPELRSALARLGSSRLFSFSTSERLEFLESFIDAVVELSNKRIGALFAIQRSISLKEHLETGVALDAEFSSELVQTIFFPKTALHDGGMILSQGRVSAAGCVFPVSRVELADRSTGLRHRAAMGLTEVTDAVAVIVSEETGQISLCIDGSLKRNLSKDELREAMESVFLPTEKVEENQDDHETTEHHTEKLDSETGLSDAGDSDLVSD